MDCQCLNRDLPIPVVDDMDSNVFFGVNDQTHLLHWKSKVLPRYFMPRDSNQHNPSRLISMPPCAIPTARAD